jgi:hypothetical protein
MSFWTYYIGCLQQPLIIFLFVFFACYFWFTVETAIVIALVMSLFVRGILELLYVTNENFCSLHYDRWCPEKDACFSAESTENKTMDFLNDTDRFIKILYDFTDVDKPTYAMP